MLNGNLQSFQLLEIIHVLDSISWVRCASGNVVSIYLDITIDISVINYLVDDID